MLKALRDNLGLLALLVVLVGTSETETYYAAFGLRYQLLSISGDHLLYRGLLGIFNSWIVFLCYAAGVLIIAGQSRLALLLGGLDRLRWSNYVFVACLSLIAWFAAARLGISAANNDTTAENSKLPSIAKLVLKGGVSIEGIEGAGQGYKLLLHTSNGAYLVKPVRDSSTEQPIVRFFAGGVIESMSLCARC